MCRMSMAVFVRILSTIFTLVFMEQKICLRYFKIQEGVSKSSKRPQYKSKLATLVKYT